MFKNNEHLKDALSYSIAEKAGGRGTRIIGKHFHSNVRWLLLQPVCDDADWELNEMPSAVLDEGASWGLKLFIVSVV